MVEPSGGEKADMWNTLGAYKEGILKGDAEDRLGL